MCDVTNRKIRDTIPNNKPPQVTFSCTRGGPQSNMTDPLGFTNLGQGNSSLDEKLGSCGFQFWVDRIESFYCQLNECSWKATHGADTNETHYECEKVECSCVPGRFLCGENGSVSKHMGVAELT